MDADTREVLDKALGKLAEIVGGAIADVRAARDAQFRREIIKLTLESAFASQQIGRGLAVDVPADKTIAHVLAIADGLAPRRLKC